MTRLLAMIVSFTLPIPSFGHAQSNGSSTQPQGHLTAQAQTSVSLANFRGDWVGESTAKRPLRLVVTDTEATFYYGGQQIPMQPPVVQGNKMVMRFAAADGYIQLDKKSATELAWYYQGNAQVSNAVLRPATGPAK